MGLFDERKSVTHPDFGNERLVACRNPDMSVVLCSKRSEAAMRKIQTKKLDDGSASSFRTLLRLLSQRNKCRTERK